jgi:hypothetical protein
VRKRIVQREIFPLLLTVDYRTEILAMSVLLSNLVARTPTIEDFYPQIRPRKKKIDKRGKV